METPTKTITREEADFMSRIEAAVVFGISKKAGELIELKWFRKGEFLIEGQSKTRNI
jgi:hypothetical protein